MPTYQQHYSIPESPGADVRKLPLRAENGYLPDIGELRRLVNSGTKVISFSNPNNPTGSLMDRGLIEEIIRIAAEVGAYVLSDEVYRGMSQSGDAFGVSETFCVRLPKETGVLFTPASAFAVEGTVRIGYANNHAVLKEGLSLTSTFLKRLGTSASA